MKQKNKISQPATKSDLKNLGVDVHQEITTLEIKVDIKLERVERRIDDNAKKYRDQVLTSNDKLAKQLETMREENLAGFNQTSRQINDHEKRIGKLEHFHQSA